MLICKPKKSFKLQVRRSMLSDYWYLCEEWDNSPTYFGFHGDMFAAYTIWGDEWHVFVCTDNCIPRHIKFTYNEFEEYFETINDVNQIILKKEKELW